MERKLHIGGREVKEGWEILNAVDAPGVDYCMNAADLSRFSDGTFAAIYASHVLEHLDYKSELSATLREWLRVLQPGGTLFASVPDLEILSLLIHEKQRLDINERFFVMRMMFGGHVDSFDYHVTGLTHEFLASFLNQAGYTEIQVVAPFGIFNDTSSMKFKGVLISLNMTARKPPAYAHN